MDFLGVGPLELFFIVIIAIIILGPKDMKKTGRTLGKWLNTLVRSDTWKVVKQASNKIKYLPNELMREAGIDELNKIGKEIDSEITNQTIGNYDDPFDSWKYNPSAKEPISEESQVNMPTKDINSSNTTVNNSNEITEDQNA